MTTHPTFEAYGKAQRNARFTDWLKERAGEQWRRATEHPFTVAIGDDSMPEGAYGHYVIQDRHFVDAFTSVIGFAIARASALTTQRRLARFIAGEINEDADFFQRTFAALGISPEAAVASPASPATRAMNEAMLTAGREGDYADALVCIVAAEWVYLTWGLREAKKPRPRRAYLAEWIDLHAVPGFEALVTWLREELDRVGAALPAVRQEEIARRFTRLCELEAAFFDYAWDQRK